MNNSLFFKKLKFYQWAFEFLSNVSDVNIPDLLWLGPSRLLQKLIDSLFFHTAFASIYKEFLHYYNIKPIYNYFTSIPCNRWNPYNYVLYAFKDEVLNDASTTNIDIIYRSFDFVFKMWHLFPECISELNKYYPFLSMTFDEREFNYIDSWIKVLHVFEDLLGHLLINDTPLIEARSSSYLASYPFSSSDLPKIQPPLKENINFFKHFEIYYFGEGSHPAFLDVMTLYLNNRLSLKEKCQNAWKNDIACDKNVSNNLTIYFVCNYLTKNISEHTWRYFDGRT